MGLVDWILISLMSLVALVGVVKTGILLPTMGSNKESIKAAYSIKVLEGGFSWWKPVVGLFRAVEWSMD